MNVLVATGRLTADPVMRSAADGSSYANFTLAVDTTNKNADGERITNFYRVTAFRRYADTVVKYLHKGSRIVVCGDLLFRTYVKKDGSEGYSLDITLRNFDFADTRGRDYRDGSAKQSAQSASQPAMPEPEEDLPF